MENKQLEDIQSKVKNCEISVNGAIYYLLILIFNELKDIKEFLINNNSNNNSNNNINSINNKKGVKNGK